MSVWCGGTGFVTFVQPNLQAGVLKGWCAVRTLQEMVGKGLLSRRIGRGEISIAFLFQSVDRAPTETTVHSVDPV